jgi:hypothetical protein
MNTSHTLSKEQVLEIARRQKAILYLILVNLGLSRPYGHPVN